MLNESPATGVGDGRRVAQTVLVSIICTLFLAWHPATAATPTPSTYTNPVSDTIPAADPFVLRHGDRYYLYATNAGDGFKGWVSNDLASWLPIGYVYRKDTHTWGERLFWAPEVIAYAGAFYMVYSVSGPAGGYRICLARSQSPVGPFCDIAAPLFDSGWSCIDSDILVDRDGTPYLYFNRVDLRDPLTGVALSKIHGVRLTRDLLHFDGPVTTMLDTYQPWEDSSKTGNWCNEGAAVFRHADRYYLMFTAGHYAHPGYSIGYATARSPLGPWTKANNNPVVARVDALGVCGPGHNSIALSPDSTELFIVYHTHAGCDHMGERPLNIDRITFDPDGALRVAGPTRSPRARASGSPAPLRLDDLTPDLRTRAEEELRSLASSTLRETVRRSAEKTPVMVCGLDRRYTCTVPLRNRGHLPMQAELTLVHATAEGPSRREFTLAPGASAVARFDLRPPRSPVGRPVLLLRIVENGDTIAQDVIGLRQARTGRYSNITTRPASALILRDSLQVVDGLSSWSGPSDCSARVLVWRVYNTLEVEVDVTDDRLIANARSPWDNDGVELYYDSRGGDGALGLGPGSAQIVFVPRPADGTVEQSCRPALRDSTGVSARYEKTAQGYRMRIRLVTSAFGPPPLDAFLLDIGINDNDSTGRQSQVMWSGTRDNWNDTRCYGRMRSR